MDDDASSSCLCLAHSSSWLCPFSWAMAAAAADAYCQACFLSTSQQHRCALLAQLPVDAAASVYLCHHHSAHPLHAHSHRAVLLKAFVTSAVTLLPGQPDPYQHIAALLTNTTRLQQGRQLLLQPGRGFLQALAAQLQPGCSLQRRRGCAGALRNVAISAEVRGRGWKGCSWFFVTTCVGLFLPGWRVGGKGAVGVRDSV